MAAEVSALFPQATSTICGFCRAAHPTREAATRCDDSHRRATHEVLTNFGGVEETGRYLRAMADLEHENFPEFPGATSHSHSAGNVAPAAVPDAVGASLGGAR